MCVCVCISVCLYFHHTHTLTHTHRQRRTHRRRVVGREPHPSRGTTVLLDDGELHIQINHCTHVWHCVCAISHVSATHALELKTKKKTILLEDVASGERAVEFEGLFD
jgi:hypothetical protein